MAIPSGTVTFLFTDIEGSTKLWEHQPQAMSAALARHDILMHQAITDNDGLVFKTVGDAFCAAFWTAPQALHAALDAQQALLAEPWRDDAPIRVRMALHTGTAEERGGDYFGPSLNRIARLLSIGYGGQTLLSLATYELTRDTLPPDCTLLDLGAHVLRDLGRPEQVYQLLHPAFRSEFPPLKSLDNLGIPNNLPQQVTSFVGRERELAEIKDLLGKSPLLTLTGPGGTGKTRLSLQAAADGLDQYSDGVYLIELAPITDPLLIAQALATVLGLVDLPGQPLTQTITEWLKPKRLLLILDNCEHLVAACAALASTLLRTCPNLHILASSREALNVQGEQIYRVPSLSLPDLKTTQTPESLSQYEAVRLFIDRALLVQPNFAVTNANAPALASICHRVDGIPLALELAAARVRSLRVEEINDRLENQFRLLTGGSRTLLPRQQTLRALIDWSYDLLTDQEKSLLCRLSVFAGGWTLEAAETVCVGDDIEDWEMLDLLTALGDKSLVIYDDQSETARYRLLETVRQYGRDKLSENGQEALVRDKHALYFLAWAKGVFPHLRTSEQGLWFARLETEHDNFRAALAWFAEMPDDTGAMDRLRLAGTLYWFWYVRSYLGEGRRHLTEALAAPGAQGLTPERANGLNFVGILAYAQGDYEVARPLFEESLALSQALGAAMAVAQALNSLGLIARIQGDYAEAIRRYEACLTIYREANSQEGIAGSLVNLGYVAYVQGNLALARTHYEECLKIRRACGHTQGIADALLGLGSVIADQQDYLAARSLFEECLELFQALGYTQGVSDALINLGNLAGNEGDYALARTRYEESLAIARELGHKAKIANALRSLSGIANHDEDYTLAHLFIEESLALARELGLKDEIAAALLTSGSIAMNQNDDAQAAALFAESLSLLRELGDKQRIAIALEEMARLSALQSQPLRAVRLFGASQALRVSLGVPLPAVEAEKLAITLANLETTLGPDVYASAYAAWQSLDFEQAIGAALDVSAGA